jgi:hypothetical protein
MGVQLGSVANGVIGGAVSGLGAGGVGAIPGALIGGGIAVISGLFSHKSTDQKYTDLVKNLTTWEYELRHGRFGMDSKGRQLNFDQVNDHIYNINKTRSKVRDWQNTLLTSPSMGTTDEYSIMAAYKNESDGVTINGVPTGYLVPPALIEPDRQKSSQYVIPEPVRYPDYVMTSGNYAVPGAYRKPIVKAVAVPVNIPVPQKIPLPVVITPGAITSPLASAAPVASATNYGIIAAVVGGFIIIYLLFKQK